MEYAESLRYEFIDKYYMDIVDTVKKYTDNLYKFEEEAREKNIKPGQAALQRWEGTRDYYLFASVYIQSAGFLINMYLDNNIEVIVA